MNFTTVARTIYLFLIAIIILTGCRDTTMNQQPSSLQTSSLSEKDWTALSLKKIYFGHMSVGSNIIDGIKDLMSKNPEIKLNIQETSDISTFQNGVFAHSNNGQNANPKSKIDAFVTTMNSGIGNRADIAFFKFCYVDFDENTDVKDVFNYYKTAMNSLVKKYPNTVIPHATVPLTTEAERLRIKERVKDIIKKIIGRATRADLNVASNIKRNEFNALLIKEYDEKNILDIAAYESTSPDGKEYLSKSAGAKHRSMVPAYTTDGGHLNEKGRLVVADKFIAKLAGIR
ncbi:MAG: hypothetical protein JXA07_08950 [Spirochaetes bacterium]|nr:hypothetical protein [Spirochaetota bacterium]